MSRARRFLDGVVLAYGYQALLVVVGLWLTPFYLGRISQHDFGLWLVGTQLLTYLTLMDVGIVALLPQEIAYATGRAGRSEKAYDLPEIVGRTARLVLYQVPIVILVAVAIWMSTSAAWQELRGPLLLVIGGFIVTFPLRILPALLQGLQDLSFTAAIQIANWALSTVATVCMVLAGWGLYALAAGWVIGQTVLMPVLVYRLRTRFPEVIPKSLPPLSWTRTREQLSKGFWVSVSQIAQLLLSNTDLLIIGRLLGPAAVVPYACTGKLASVLANQVQILMQTATPALCELKAGESRQRVFQVLVALNHGVLAFSGLVFCVVMLVNQWFVTWWVSAGQYGGQALTIALIVTMVFRHWNTVAAYSVFCFGHQRRISLTNLADGLITAAASIGFTVLWGPVGAPLGSLAGVCLVSLPCNLRIIAHDTAIGLPLLVGAMLEGWAWRFLLTGAAALGIAMFWSPRHISEAAGIVAGSMIAYLLIMLSTVQRSPLARYLETPLSSLRSKYVQLHMKFSG
jgi:O-antigen/teichoic acid export membrane protein